MKFKFYAPFLLVICTNTWALSLDEYLGQKIKLFNLIPKTRITQNQNNAQIELGKRLFMETDISGNRNVSCMTCHSSYAGTSDLLPLSRTEDSNGILRRNALSLFNLGNSSFMFWDGRVHYDSTQKKFTTPEPNLPAHITGVMTSALSAQALFPMVSREEMRGRIGENEIADAENNLEAWDKIVLRLKNQARGNNRGLTYSQLFRQAYPDTEISKINIGHVAEAIGAFEKVQFQSTGSPFTQYLNGNKEALTEKQKRGLALFVGQARCINCHAGSELGDNSFFASVGVPQWGAEPVTADMGRAEITKNSGENYFFRTPSLLNIALTAPYMHNGAFRNLREVINHYNDIPTSLRTYEIPENYKKIIPVAVSAEKREAKLQEVWNSVQMPFLRRGLKLSESDKDDLEAFLTESLTDPKWKLQ
jgi:cytochrome c peroxidase